MDKSQVHTFCKNEVATNDTLSGQLCAPVTNQLGQCKQERTQCRINQAIVQKQEQAMSLGLGLGLGGAGAALVGAGALAAGYACGKRKGKKEGIEQGIKEAENCKKVLVNLS